MGVEKGPWGQLWTNTASLGALNIRPVLEGPWPLAATFRQDAFLRLSDSSLQALFLYPNANFTSSNLACELWGNLVDCLQAMD